MKSDTLKIVGPSARVAIAGETNIANETQKLRVRVQPTLSGTVSVGAAALLLANPILGAAVGAGTLLAQTALKDPIEQRVAEAVGRGAQLVLLPEYFGIFGARSIDKVAAREPDGAGPQQDFLARAAREHGVWVVGGASP